MHVGSLIHTSVTSPFVTTSCKALIKLNVHDVNHQQPRRAVLARQSLRGAKASTQATRCLDEVSPLPTTTQKHTHISKKSSLHRAIGYSLHPKIASKLPENARIADIATGTGIWLKDLASLSPSTYTFHGYDISSEQFLPAESLPSNVSLGSIDFKKPIPTELQRTFDVVNVRLIIISMGPYEVWQATLKNLITLLKPGGCITWTDGNFLIARGFRGSDPQSTCGHALTTGQRQLNTTLRKRFGFSFPDFGQLFRDAGLEGVEEDVISTDRLAEQRREFTEIGVGAVFGGLSNLSKAGEDGYWTKEEVEERRALAVRDMESGAYLRWDIHVAVGFKPV